MLVRQAAVISPFLRENLCAATFLTLCNTISLNRFLRVIFLKFSRPPCSFPTLFLQQISFVCFETSYSSNANLEKGGKKLLLECVRTFVLLQTFFNCSWRESTCEMDGKAKFSNKPQVATNESTNSFAPVLTQYLNTLSLYPFTKECCGPNGPSINTRVTLSPHMLPADYLNCCLLPNHLQCMCQFLALPQSYGLLVSLSTSLEVIIHHVIILGLLFCRTRCPLVLVSKLPSSCKILLIPSSS